MKPVRLNFSILICFGFLVPGFLVIIGLLTINIVDRFFLGSWLGLMWVEEVCVIIMVWLIFIAALAVDRNNSHIRVQIISLPPRLAQIIEDIVMVSFFGFLVWSTWELMPRVFSRYAATGWTIKVGYYSMIVGGSLAIVNRVAKYLPHRISKWF